MQINQCTKQLKTLNKAHLEWMRLEGIPVPLDANTVAIGNWVVHRTTDDVKVKKLQSSEVISVQSMEIGVLYARCARMGQLQRLVELMTWDRQIASLKFELKLLNQLKINRNSQNYDAQIEEKECALDDLMTNIRELETHLGT